MQALLQTQRQSVLAAFCYLLEWLLGPQDEKSHCPGRPREKHGRPTLPLR
jgi:hypothetical protein